MPNLLPVDDEELQKKEVAATSTAPVVSQPVLSNVQGNETVKGQLKDLLATSNPLMEQARNRATTYAATRGLQNSTLAAQAGEEAFVSQALPIAQQDATTYGNRAVLNTNTQNQFGLQQQSGEIQGTLQAQQGQIQGGLQAQQGEIQSRLAREGAGYASNLSAQEASQKLTELSKAGDINSQLQAEQAKQRLTELAAQGDQAARLALQEYEQNRVLNRENAAARQEEIKLSAGFESQLADQNFRQSQQAAISDFARTLQLSDKEQAQTMERMETQHRQTLAQIEAQAKEANTADAANYARSIGGSYLTAVTNRQTQASNEIAQIYQTQGLSSVQQQAAVRNAYSRMQTDNDAIALFYQSSPAWDDSWTTPTAPAAAAPAAAPAPGTFSVPGGGTYTIPNFRF